MIATKEWIISLTKRKKPLIGFPVLYISMGRDGNQFVSDDAYKYLFTVTGALWTPQGRSFNGTSDDISKTIANFQSSDLSGTILVWFKTTDLAVSRTLFGSSDTSGALYFFEFYVDGSGYLQIHQRNNDTVDQVRGGTLVNDAVWHLGAVVSDGSTWSLYVDGIAEILTVASGANTGDWLSDTPNRDNITIGVLTRSTSVRYFSGTIGEILVYSRVLSPYEIWKIYQATKWRYK